MSLVFGRDDANNPVPYVVYVWLWVGMPFLSLVFGAIWAVLNPVRWLHRGVAALARIPRDFTLTDLDLGYWPAAAGLLAFTWLELVAPDRTTLLVLRLAVGLFVLVSVVGSLTFGERWFREGDPFEVLSRLYGRMSPLGRRPDGRLVLRSPVHGPSLLSARRGLLATAAVMLGGTAYDSLSADIRYAGWVQSTAAPDLARTGTLLGVVVLVGGALHLAAAISAWLSGVPVRGVAADLAPSLLPIAAGYLVAHYYSLLAFQGPRTLALLSDPLGTGANWLGTGGVTPWAWLIQPTLVAVVQAVAIVIGHVLGVVVAHERAIRILPHRAAVVGQVPLMVLMVALHRGRPVAAVQRLTRSPRRRRRPLPDRGAGDLLGQRAHRRADRRTAGRTPPAPGPGAGPCRERWGRRDEEHLVHSREAGQRLGHPLLRVGADGSGRTRFTTTVGAASGRCRAPEARAPGAAAPPGHTRRRPRPRRPGRGC